MTFNDIDEIKKAGFSGFKKMSELFLDSSMLPNNNGVYLVLNIDNKPGDFLTVGSGGHFKGKDPNISLAELKSNWVENTKVVYIGKATSLRSRLKQYFGFGQGKNIGHYGGRLIWQLKYSKDLVVCWKSLTIDPREFEADLIQQFVKTFGCRPFANLAN
ncbi:MAG TPA: GIY-YIG nuclease family protein [Bacteroidales bacterium]|nr:GIY-YIG nuclease family protein [Bacteroidales bacterium]